MFYCMFYFTCDRSLKDKANAIHAKTQSHRPYSSQEGSTELLKGKQ